MIPSCQVELHYLSAVRVNTEALQIITNLLLQIINNCIGRLLSHTQLHDQVFIFLDGHIEVVKYLLSKGANINTNANGSNCLHVASQKGRVEIVEYILQNYNMGVNKRNGENETSLFIASENGQLAVVEELIRHGSDLEATGKYGMTPLLAACSSGRIDVIRVLLDSDADLMAETDDGTNCLILAAGMEKSNLGRNDDGPDILDELLELDSVRITSYILFNIPTNSIKPTFS